MVKKYDENDGIHLERIIGGVPCRTHQADLGQACWNIGSARGILKAICDKRARSAGANGPITPYKKKEFISHKKEGKR